MSPLNSRRIRLRSDGGLTVRLPAGERELLGSLPVELVRLLDELGDGPLPDPLKRLFPPAYPSDASSEAAYRNLVGADLLEAHRHALEVLADTADKSSLSKEQAEAWLTALNELRLVLGTSLQVTEESAEVVVHEERQVEWTYYHYLSFLLGEIVEELSKGLPSPDEDEDLPEDPWGEPPGGLRWDGTPLPDR